MNYEQQKDPRENGGPDVNDPNPEPNPKPYPVEDPPVEPFPEPSPGDEPTPDPFPGPPEPIPVFPPDIEDKTIY